MRTCSIDAVSTGYAVRGLLRRSDGPAGVVHSVFRRAFNVVTQGGRFLSCSTRDVPPAPNNIVTDLPSETGWLDLVPAPGAEVFADDREIRLGDGLLAIALDRGTTFVPRIWGPVELDISRTFAALELAARAGHKDCRIRTDGRDGGLEAGFRELLPLAGRLFESGPWQPSSFRGLFCASGYRYTADLVQAILAGDEPSITESARHLLGLGPGLTPSGDDALSGLMISLALTAKAHGFGNLILEKVNPAIIAGLPGATGELSQDFLRYAALGQGSSVSEEVVIHILAGCETELSTAAERLCAIGASSGTDQLWGILVGIRLGLKMAEGQGKPVQATI